MSKSDVPLILAGALLAFLIGFWTHSFHETPFVSHASALRPAPIVAPAPPQSPPAPPPAPAAEAPTAQPTPPVAQPAPPAPAPAPVADIATTTAAAEILQRADEVRNPQLDYTVLVSVTSIKPGESPRSARYEVLVKGRDRTVIKTLEPPVDRGRVLLMRDRDLWAYMPTISKPLRISLRERLIGDVANGDLARVNFAGDYTPTLLRTEHAGAHDCYVLNLAANADDVTYSRVVLWVRAETFDPLKAEFYAVSGRLLKTCAYEAYQELAGRVRPTQLVMTDALARNQQSTITYERMTVASLPDKYFMKDYLTKLVAE